WRAIKNLPAFQARKQKYCLITFGPQAALRVWFILDGDRLFVDRNANGDLTDEGECIPGKFTETTELRRIMNKDMKPGVFAPLKKTEVAYSERWTPKQTEGPILEIEAAGKRYTLLSLVFQQGDADIVALRNQGHSQFLPLFHEPPYEEGAFLSFRTSWKDGETGESKSFTQDVRLDSAGHLAFGDSPESGPVVRI